MERDRCLGAIFGLSSRSLSKYKSITRRFQHHHLAALTLFLLYLGGERRPVSNRAGAEAVQAIGESVFYHQILEICAGPYSGFEALMEHLLTRKRMSDYHFDTSDTVMKLPSSGTLLTLSTHSSARHSRKSGHRVGPDGEAAKGVICLVGTTREPLSVADIHHVRSNGWSGKDLLDKLIALDYELIEALTVEHEGTTAQWAPVFIERPDTWRLIIDSAETIVGYWHFVPLFTDDIEKAKKAKCVIARLRRISYAFSLCRDGTIFISYPWALCHGIGHMALACYFLHC
jgi:hypothetical protein